MAAFVFCMFFLGSFFYFHLLIWLVSLFSKKQVLAEVSVTGMRQTIQRWQECLQLQVFCNRLKQSSTQKWNLRLSTSSSPLVPCIYGTFPERGGGVFVEQVPVFDMYSSHFWETAPPLRSSPLSSFLYHRANKKAQWMRSREPAVKPKGFTAGFPYDEWRRQHLTTNPKIGQGADIGLLGQAGVHIFKGSSYSIL